MSVEVVRSVCSELPAQAAWMHGLARSLVRDSASADDVAQETALAALRGGPREPKALRAWLGRVAGNFARKRVRDAASRARIERDVAKPEALPAVDDDLARLEVQRALVDELRELSDPYRSTLLRRYFDGWSAARIAREQRIPQATVRWRIQRGLELMRERLDRRHRGDRTSWQLALLPLVGARPPLWSSDAIRAASTHVIQGALLMKGVLQVTTVGAALLAVGLSVWWGAGAEHAASPTPNELAVAPLGRAIQVEPDTSTGGVAAAADSAREAIASPAAPVAAPPAADVPKLAWLEARIVDNDARPVRGASMVDHRAQGALPEFSDGEGKVRLESELASAQEERVLRVEAKGLATLFVEARVARGSTTQLGDVVLAPAGVVRGRVQDTDNHPIGGARVLVTAPDMTFSDGATAKRCGPRVWPGAPSAVSLGDGTFTVEGVALGGARAWAEVSGMRYAYSEPITVRADDAGGEVVLVVEALDPRDEIAGVVLAPDGTPVAMPTLRLRVESRGTSNSWSATGDERGKFSFRVLSVAPYDITAVDPAGRWQDTHAPQVEPGTHDLELRFVENHFIEIAARRDGRPVPRFVVRSIDDRDRTIESARNLSEVAGRANLRAPLQRFWIEIAAAGCALDRRGPFEPATPPSRIDFDLRSTPGITGRITAGGSALAGATVSLWKCATSDQQIEVEGYAALVEPQAVDQFVTADDGEYFLRVPASGEFVVRAEHAAHAPGEVGPLSTQPGVALADLDLALGSGGAIEGRVIAAPGRSRAGVIVAINHGDAHPRTARSDEQGAFRFEGVMPGRWRVARGKNEVGESQISWGIGSAKTAPTIDFNCTVEEGRTARCDVDLRDAEPCQVAGHLSINGSPARHWTLAVWPGDASTVSGELPNTSIDESGDFQIALDEPGVSRFSFRPPQEVGQDGRFDVRVELKRGANEWKADFVLARIDGRAPPPAPDAGAIYFAAGKGDVSCMLGLRLGAGGEFSLPLVPVGRGSFQRLEERAGGSHEWVPLLEVDVKPGSNPRVELP